MIRRSIVLAGAAVVLGSFPAWAQGTTTLNENINNSGLPRNAPSLGLSSIYGLNPCSSGASVGVSTPLFGIGGAISDIDKECETRNNAAVVITGLKDETLAREILCQIKDIRQAAIRVGKPCLQDQSAPRVSSAEPVKPEQPQVASVEPPKPVPPQPQVQLATRVAVAQPVSVTVRPGAPAFCRMKDLDISLYPDCTGAAPASTVGPSGPAPQPAKTTQTPEATKVPWMPTSAEKRPVVAPRLAGCATGRAAKAGSGCQTGAQVFAVLEQKALELIERRRLALMEVEVQRVAMARADNESTAASARAPTQRGPLMASAAPMDR